MHKLPQARDHLRGTALPGYWQGWDDAAVLALLKDLEETYDIVARKDEERGVRVQPRYYQLADTFAAYYAAEDELRDLQSPPRSAWHYILRQLTRRDDFIRTKAVTEGSYNLALAASARALAVLLRRLVADKKARKTIEEATRKARAKARKARTPRERARALEEAMEETGAAAYIDAATEDAAEAARKTAEELGELEAKAEAASLALGAGGHGYQNLGLSVKVFLENPDEYRKKLALLLDAVRFLPRASRAVSTAVHRMTTMTRPGIPAGAKKMTSLDELQDLTATELALLGAHKLVAPGLARAVQAYTAVRLAERQALVRARYATATPVVYVDKSGSMDQKIPGGPAKIAAAAAIALAFTIKHRASEVYFFDTEVHPAASRRRIIEELLSVKATGGTNITNVIRHIAENDDVKKQYIIITDGIDDPNDTTRQLLTPSLRRRITMIVLPPGWPGRWEGLVRVYRADNDRSLLEAVSRAMSS